MSFTARLFLITILLVAGCSSDDPPPADDQGPTVDQNTFRNDIGGTPTGDTYVWPDTQSTGDMWQWPDLYSGTPFGCQTDADCFGRACCSTPWGVKVCADSCTP